MNRWLLALLAALCIAALGLQMDDVDAARAVDADRADAIQQAATKRAPLTEEQP